MDLTGRDVEVHIDELVLEGVAGAQTLDAEVLGEAIGRALTRLLAGQDTGDAAAAAPAESIGASVAEAIYRELGQ
jgi:hypothetical protein